MKSPHVYDLIQTLSKAEKRFFRLFSRSVGGQAEMGYLDLFDILENMETYQEAELLEQVSDRSYSGHISTTRNRLFNQILRSQRALKAGRSVDSQLRMVLEEVEILYQRGLYKPSEKKVRKALKLARKYEKESLMLDLLDWYWRLKQKDGIDEQKRSLEVHLNEHKACLERISLQNRLKYHFEQSRMLIRLMPNPRAEDEKAAYTSLLGHPELSTPPPSERVLSTIYFHLSHGLCQLALGDLNLAYHHLHTSQKTWDEHPHFVPEYTELYLASINIFVNILFVFPEHLGDFPEVIGKLRNVPKVDSHTRVQLEWVAFHQELIYSMNFRSPRQTTTLISEIEDWIQRSVNRIPTTHQLGFFYNFSAFFFMQGSWEEANRWVIRILHLPEGPERQDIRDFARLFQTILQFELGNYDLNEYLVRSTYRYMTRNRRYHHFEKTVLKVINRSIQAKDEKELQDAFLGFQNEVVEMMQSKTGKQILGLREVYLWSISHLQRKNIKEVFQEVLQANQKAGPQE